MSFSEGFRVWVSGRSARAIAALFICLALSAVAAARAGADAFGQLGSWGTYGVEEGQFFNPQLFGVDSTDGSVYLLDFTPEFDEYRIQKFSEDGTTVEGTAMIPRPNLGGLGRILVEGIAVDHARGRFYLLQYQKGADTSNGNSAAEKILAFSTTPNGSNELVPASTPTLPVPSPEGTEALDEPRDLAVDPNNGDLVILAKARNGRAVVQRISESGVARTPFVDSEDLLKVLSPGWRTALAVGPDGTDYLLSGPTGSSASTEQQAWTLPPSGPQVLAKVPGFEATQKLERGQVFDLAQGEEPIKATGKGPVVAISPDGGTLYWKTNVGVGDGVGSAGDFLVHGFSLADQATSVVYGGGSASCAITYRYAALGVVANRLLVFDQGPEVEEEGEEPPFGGAVLRFGPGGNGCAPYVAFVTPDHGPPAGGTSVTIKGANFEGATSVKINNTSVAFTVDSASEISATTPANSAGVVGVTVTGPNGSRGRNNLFTFANQFNLKVLKAGTGSGTVSGGSPAEPSTINCGSGAGCEHEYTEGALVTLTAAAAGGSSFAGWSGAGCTGTGSCEVTMSAAKEVTATFNLNPLPKFNLKVLKAGTGSGTVSGGSPAEPSTINCGSGAGCEHEYTEGALVTLTAAAAGGSSFAGWSGAGCTGTGSCEVTMSAAKEVTATFNLNPLPKFNLKVLKAGTGSGTVSGGSPAEPSTINCGSGAGCEHEYTEGALVTLTAAAAGGSSFAGWSGAGCTGTGSCEVTMSAAKEVTATFNANPLPKFKLKVSKVGTGGGTVTSLAPNGGINCGVGAACEAEFEEGKQVELSQAPDGSSEFVKWTGACTGSGSCKVTMSAAKEVSAEFKAKAKPKFKLSVSKSGTGSGSVLSSNPAGGINCGADCEEEYESGVLVTLTQTAAAGSEFKEWTGACTGSGACQVTMNAASAVGARFDAAPAKTCATDPSLCLKEEKPRAKPLKCKRGFVKRKVHGKLRCVRVKKHHKPAHKKRAHASAVTAEALGAWEQLLNF